MKTYKIHLIRQHGYGAVYQVDAGGTLLCLLVDDGTLGDVVGDVGNMDAHFPQPIHRPDGQCIVEVLRIGDQSTAPGPPSDTAVATPMMLPVPMVAANEVARAANWLTSPLESLSFFTEIFSAVHIFR